ncbi:MAG: hypothetical protein DMF74_04825 [Acidobacteria bacterium]|nr:MAG: hypothetical protein DMF74_04825 [Acidobacteriota bacterium]
MNYKRRISTSISVLALFLSLVIPISNQAFVESSSPRQKVSHVSDARMNRSNLVDRSSIVKAVNKNETVSNKRNTVVTWRGGQSDHRWSNPGNWVGAHVPGASDVARFPTQSNSDVDVDSIGMIAGLKLEPGYSGTITLKHDLLVAGEVVIASGSFEQGSYSLSAREYSQSGGVFNGGSTKVTISGEATVSGGTLTTPRLMSAESLLINSPGVVRMSANGKLELSGNGEPLKGSGLLDVTTHKPNSVEYTGQANVDLTAARPAMQLHSSRHIARDDMPSEPESSQGQDAKTPETPESFGKLGSLTLNRGDSYLEAAAIDTAGGFAYFGCATNPGTVVKVRLSDFTRVGALVLNPGEDFLGSAAIDPVGGFAYFGTITTPARVVKVRLSDFTRVAGLTLNSGENFARATVIDSVAGFGYVGTNTSPGNVVKIRLSDMTRVAGLALNTPENFLRSAVIDTVGGFVYFGTATSPGNVVKVRLADLTRVGGLTLNTGETSLRCAVIDVAGGFAYFGAPSTVIKVRLSDFTRVGALTLSAGENSFRSAVIDTAGGFAYFASYTFPSLVIKVRLSDFTRVATLNLNAGENFVFSALIDPAGGFAYFGTDTSPGRVVKVRLSDFTRFGVLRLTPGEDALISAVIDTAGGFAYFGTYTEPGTIVKVRLSDFTRVGALTLNSGEDDLYSAVIDPAGGFAYFGTDTFPGIVVKIRLSDFTRVGSLTLGPNEVELGAAVIDPAAGFAYFCNFFSIPAAIVKIRLSDFTRVGVLNLDNADGIVTSAVIDPAGGFAYFGAGSAGTGGRVVKVRLSDFSRVSALTLNATEDFLFTAVIDPAAGFAYFGNQNVGSVVTKVRLSDLTRVGAVNFNAGEDFLGASVIDPAGGFAYFATLTSPGMVVKLRLSDFTRVGGLILNEDTFFGSAVIDPALGLAYFGTENAPGVIVKVDISSGLGPKMLQFNQSSYVVTEASTSVTITVNRLGDASSAATVDYATSDGTATERSDYITARGTLRFAPGETSKSFTVLINDDSFVEGTETFNVTLSNPTGVNLSAPPTVTVYINDNLIEPATNVIDDPQNFVRQHYHDFLNREADASGLAFWINEITSCGTNQSCIQAKRINVSAAYFLSIEFQQTGYLVERMYKAAYGDGTGASTFGGVHTLAVPIIRFNEFLPDTQQIGQGVVVGQTGWEAVLEANKQAFANQFVQRARFTTALPTTLTPTQFVNQLFTNAGVTPTTAERNTAIAEFGSATNTTDVAARARALRDVAENATLNTQEFNRAFVLMQYFGYLRRNPNDPQDNDYTGFDFWLTKLNQFNGNYNAAEMVKAFITSVEYRQRFGP